MWLDDLAAILGITLNYGTIDADWGRPAQDSPLFSNYEQAGRLLDAFAWNVGCVVVRNLDGTYTLQEPDDGDLAAVANRPAFNLAGGNPNQVEDDGGYLATYGMLPGTVTVTFPKFVTGSTFTDGRDCRNHTKASYGDVYDVTVTLAGAGLAAYPGFSNGTMLIHDTARAYYATSESPTPGNAVALASLANLIARFYYRQQLYGYDEAYQGIRAWTPEGIHDVIWTYRNGKATTRVQRRPLNWTQAEFQHEAIGLSGGSGSGVCGAHTVKEVNNPGIGADVDVSYPNINQWQFYYPYFEVVPSALPASANAVGLKLRSRDSAQAMRNGGTLSPLSEGPFGGWTTLIYDTTGQGISRFQQPHPSPSLAAFGSNFILLTPGLWLLSFSVLWHLQPLQTVANIMRVGSGWSIYNAVGVVIGGTGANNYIHKYAHSTVTMPITNFSHFMRTTTTALMPFDTSDAAYAIPIVFNTSNTDETPLTTNLSVSYLRGDVWFSRLAVRDP
jgi:hypothetical protein